MIAFERLSALDDFARRRDQLEAEYQAELAELRHKVCMVEIDYLQDKAALAEIEAECLKSETPMRMAYKMEEGAGRSPHHAWLLKEAT